MRLIFFRKSIVSALLGISFAVLMLVIFSFILSKQADPKKNSLLFSLIALLLGALLTGRSAAHNSDSRIVGSIFAATLYILAVLVPSVIISELSAISFLKILACAVCAVAGAMLGKKGSVRSTSGKRRKDIIKRYAK